MEPQIVDYYNECPHMMNIVDKMNEEYDELYKEEKATYEDMMTNQINSAKEKMGEADLQKIISGTNTWEVS